MYNSGNSITVSPATGTQLGPGAQALFSGAQGVDPDPFTRRRQCDLADLHTLLETELGPPKAGASRFKSVFQQLVIKA